MITYESLYPDAVPSEVAPTLSFANSHVLRIDTNYLQGPMSKRVITYPSSSEKMIESVTTEDAASLDENVLEPQGLFSQALSMSDIRESLAGEGLVLGHQVDEPNKDFASFIIPGSARPAKYDAPHEGDGPFSYGDASMFSDMGHLLARLALLGPEHPVVIDRAVGLNTAIVEFTRVNERKLLLVPGFELSLKSVEDDDKARDYYENKLQEEFGKRFVVNSGSFFENFSRVFGGILDTKQ